MSLIFSIIANLFFFFFFLLIIVGLFTGQRSKPDWTTPFVFLFISNGLSAILLIYLLVTNGYSKKTQYHERFPPEKLSRWGLFCFLISLACSTLFEALALQRLTKGQDMLPIIPIGGEIPKPSHNFSYFTLYLPLLISILFVFIPLQYAISMKFYALWKHSYINSTSLHDASRKWPFWVGHHFTAFVCPPPPLSWLWMILPIHQCDSLLLVFYGYMLKHLFQFFFHSPLLALLCAA